MKTEKKYSQRFRSVWETDPRFEDWLRPVETDSSKAYCTACNVIIQAHLRSLIGHSEAKKHRLVMGGEILPKPSKSKRKRPKSSQDPSSEPVKIVIMDYDEKPISTMYLDQLGTPTTFRMPGPRAITFGILTVSDRCSRGEAKDESGTNLASVIKNKLPFKGKVVQRACVPDEEPVIKDKLIEWCVKEKMNIILTTGGTGFSPRDVTPEAVKKVIEKEAPALSTQMTVESLKVTPLAMLSRPVCGIRGSTLIVTLPGSKKGAEECLGFITSAIPHAVDLITEQVTSVKETHTDLQSLVIEHVPSDEHVQSSEKTSQHRTIKFDHRNEVSKVDVSQVCRRDRKSPYAMMSVEDATEIVTTYAPQCFSKIVKMKDALDLVLAQDIHAKDPLPPFPASIKDGYAVIASDGAGLRDVIGSSTAGCKPEQAYVREGDCMRINTGAPIPPGADAVVQVEDTTLVNETDDGRTELQIEILTAPNDGQDIRPKGCDINEGQLILKKGTHLGPSEVGLLATVGVTEVMVISKPTVAVLSTGNELQEPGQPLKDGHIRDSNKTTLLSLLKQNNFPTVDVGIAKDDPNTLLGAIKTALSNADVLVTSGGVSMGDRDILRPVLEVDLNATIHFAQVFMKPGKPTTFATCDFEGRTKLILGLPGNPVSAVVTSNLYLLPLCRKMSGRADFMYTIIKAKLAASIQLDPRPEYHRVTLEWEEGESIPTAHSTGNQISSRLLSLASAQALLRLPPQEEDMKELPENCIVDALVLKL